MKLALLAPGLLVLAAACLAACTSAGEAAPAAPLEGTLWQLVELDGLPLPASPALRVPTLELDPAARRASGTSGVNRYTGSYESSGSQIRFGPLAATRMAGPPQAMAAEGAYLAALARVASWRIRGKELELRSADGVLARYRAAGSGE